MVKKLVEFNPLRRYTPLAECIGAMDCGPFSGLGPWERFAERNGGVLQPFPLLPRLWRVIGPAFSGVEFMCRDDLFCCVHRSHPKVHRLHV